MSVLHTLQNKNSIRTILINDNLENPSYPVVGFITCAGGGGSGSSGGSGTSDGVNGSAVCSRVSSASSISGSSITFTINDRQE